MPSDERIRELCAQALESNGAEFETAIRDLQSAIRYRLEDLSNRAVATLLKMPRVAPLRENQQEARAKTAAAGSEDEEMDQVS